MIPTKTKYQFIRFEELSYLQNGKIKYYNCLNNKSNNSLGLIEWEQKWRQYIFSSSGSDIIFSVGCLLDIVDFLKQLNRKNL